MAYRGDVLFGVRMMEEVVGCWFFEDGVEEDVEGVADAAFYGGEC